MQKTIDETTYRREKQIAYNTKNGLVPKALNKAINNNVIPNKTGEQYKLEQLSNKAAEPENIYLSKAEIDKKIKETRKMMEAAAKDLDFMQAAKLRDKLKALQDQK